MADASAAVLNRAQSSFDAGIGRLVDLLRIPSVSTDPEYRDACRAAAQWCIEHLSESGISGELHETGTSDAPGHPVVYAHHPGPASYHGPHVLFYGHYDVQPADPLELWDSPPFEPTIIREGEPRIVARGAVDDKGQVMMFLEALRAWHDETGDIPIRLTILLEGEEECGSVNLDQYLKDHVDTLRACDVCLVSDTGMWNRETPAVTYALRGLSYCEAILHGPDQDLHSGMWGGSVPNPLNELTKVFGQLFGPDGRCALPGFYDDVREVGEQERTQWKSLGIDETKQLASIGLPTEANVGEAGYSMIERQWARPTCDINGLYGGYMGKGAKTVIPSFAGAKISFRLVADQDPAKVTRSLFDWLKARTPPGCRWELMDHGSGLPCTVSTDSPHMVLAKESLHEATGKEPVLIGCGGSIPVVGSFKTLLGLDTLLLGFALDDDRVHSPNEKFELGCYEMGLRTHIVLIGKMAAAG